MIEIEDEYCTDIVKFYSDYDGQDNNQVKNYEIRWNRDPNDDFKRED